MAKQGPKMKTPRLRFPEFRGLEPWVPRPLVGFADKRVKWSFAGGPFGSNLKASDYASHGVRIIQLQNIGDGEFLSDYKIYTSTSKAEELQSCNIYPGEILLSKMGDPVGRACIVPKLEDRYVMCSDGIRLVVDEKQFSRDFVFFAINFDGFRRRVEAASTGSTRKRIGLDALKQLPLEVPQLAEQQKIADCLTSLDEVIAAQGRKVEALKAHKRGLMQQLFPREGETRPRLRFPEFRDAPEWIARRLGDLMVIGSSRRVHESDWTTKGVPFYRAREIVALGKGESIEPLFISETLYEELSGFTGEIEEGQLLVTGVGSIGIPYLVKRNDRFYFKDGNIIWFKNDQSEISGDFLYRLFESISVQTQIATMAGIGTVGTYTIENARRTVAVFPEDMREQQRIADCLSSLDTQISAETDQLAALKAHKQGLMQQLFPAPEAASA